MFVGIQRHRFVLPFYLKHALKVSRNLNVFQKMDRMKEPSVVNFTFAA